MKFTLVGKTIDVLTGKYRRGHRPAKFALAYTVVVFLAVFGVDRGLTHLRVNIWLVCVADCAVYFAMCSDLVLDRVIHLWAKAFWR